MKHIILEVTAACNLACQYCYNVWKSPGRDYPRGQLALPEVLGILDRLADELPLETVALTGGEPFLRPDLPETVAHLWARGLYVVMITNGTLLTRQRIRQTPGVSNYELPLLSYRREVHDRLTGRPAFHRVLRAAVNLKRLGEHFVFAFVATKLNYRDLERTLTLAAALGADSFVYNRMNAAPHNFPRLGELLPSVEMVRENLEVLERFAVQYSYPIGCSIPLQPCLLELNRYPHVSFGFCPSGGEGSYFTVDPLGNLRTCNHSSVILGNLLEHSFAELYQQPQVQEFRTAKPASCGGCPEEISSCCHGGCKAAAGECYGAFTREEPFLASHLHLKKAPGPITLTPA